MQSWAIYPATLFRFFGLPMGRVGKKHSFPVKYRIIHDLSWPPQDSVNNHIDPDAFQSFYGSIDDAVALIMKHGVGTMSAKLYLADAFKHIIVRSHDWPLLGSSWDLHQPDGSMVCLYYVDLFLPFVQHSSPALFNEYADALHYVPCKSTKCRTCYTTWTITVLLVHQTPWFVPTTSPP